VLCASNRVERPAGRFSSFSRLVNPDTTSSLCSSLCSSFATVRKARGLRAKLGWEGGRVFLRGRAEFDGEDRGGGAEAYAESRKNTRGRASKVKSGLSGRRCRDKISNDRTEKGEGRREKVFVTPGTRDGISLGLKNDAKR